MSGIFSRAKIERDERISSKYDAIVAAIKEVFPDDFAALTRCCNKRSKTRKIYGIMERLAEAIEDI